MQHQDSAKQLALNAGTVIFIAAISIKLWRVTRSYLLLVTNDEQMLSYDTQHAEVKP